MYLFNDVIKAGTKPKATISFWEIKSLATYRMCFSNLFDKILSDHTVIVGRIKLSCFTCTFQ